MRNTPARDRTRFVRPFQPELRNHFYRRQRSKRSGTGFSPLPQSMITSRVQYGHPMTPFSLFPAVHFNFGVRVEGRGCWIVDGSSRFGNVKERSGGCRAKNPEGRACAQSAVSDAHQRSHGAGSGTSKMCIRIFRVQLHPRHRPSPSRSRSSPASLSHPTVLNPSSGTTRQTVTDTTPDIILSESFDCP